MFTKEALTARNDFCQLYTHRRRKDSSVHSAFAEQLCSPPTDDKSPENRMGSVCFKTFCWSQTVTFPHMWAKWEALACFLHGHNAKQISSQRGWHAERPNRQETADDEGLGLGHAGERSRLGRAVSGAALRHIPAAWRTGRKIPNVKEANETPGCLVEPRLGLVRSVVTFPWRTRERENQLMVKIWYECIAA